MAQRQVEQFAKTSRWSCHVENFCPMISFLSFSGRKSWYCWSSSISHVILWRKFNSILRIKHKHDLLKLVQISSLQWRVIVPFNMKISVNGFCCQCIVSIFSVRTFCQIFSTDIPENWALWAECVRALIIEYRQLFFSQLQSTASATCFLLPCHQVSDRAYGRGLPSLRISYQQLVLVDGTRNII